MLCARLIPRSPAALQCAARAICSLKQRGRPTKKQKEEEKESEKEQQASTEKATTEEQQQTTDTTNTDKKQDDTQQNEPTKQSTDEVKTDTAAETKTDPKAKGGKGVAAGKEQEEHAAELLEKGHLYFFYRPKVDAKEVKSPDDVQKFYILMSPEGAEGRPKKEEEVEGKRGEEKEAGEEGSEGGKKHRLLVVSSKMLPPPGQRRRNPWYANTAHTARYGASEQALLYAH